MFTIDSPLTVLHGVGEKTAGLFRSRGIISIGNLLDYYPRDYDWFDIVLPVNALKPGQVASVQLCIIGNGTTVKAGAYKVTSFQAADATGRIRIVYFNMPYLQKTLQKGSVHIFRGKIRQYQNGRLEIEQPAVYSPSDYDKLQSTLQPRYPLFQGVKNTQLIRMMRQALEGCSPAEDYLPSEDREELQLCTDREATAAIHFPANAQQLAAARNRKVFDEFLSFILAIRHDKQENDKLVNSKPMIPSAQTHRLIEQLPYELTGDQQKAWQDIENDLCGNKVMNRLLQGDVGSGKTIIAFLALLLCACNRRQGALMAPTEVLAEQHMQNMQEMIHRYHLPLHPVLLTGSVKGKTRKETLAAIASGGCDVIIGTHALIQETVEYHDLGLVITDEQHRFGVRQREALSGKGESVPVLVMSATPIPRTLAIIMYGDLSVSILKEMPGNRRRIKNLAIDQQARGRVYRFILSQVQAGRQAYIICPCVDRSDHEEDDSGSGNLQRQMSAENEHPLENVVDYTNKLRDIFPPAVRIEMLHGRMKPSYKNQIMTAFARHDIDILVSTTVIEVGINVPNASTILIENAERFGLSQLHQLRGRVGRGPWQSYCIFMYSRGIEEKPKRLQILEKSNDGFEIAEEDLKLRGPGDIFGIRQSGEFGFQLADIYEDAGVMEKAAAYADEILRGHKQITPPVHYTIDYRSI